ncbi:tRNA dihydrouridine synthase [Legionella lytica]|uniref:tRNA-dihydrouridine synthase n=1 Tax=Legionella lytica TaxID=96232 RepID=A0ABW8DBT8_9GAMM
MHAFINSPLQIGSLTVPHRLIQGPLAGYSCAPFRTLFNRYSAPAYCVTEMSSAMDVVHRHDLNSRYIYRSPEERYLAYQISGTESRVLAQAAVQLEAYGADLIDINCGCPKPKIRKKGAGSALLETPERLADIVKTVRAAITIPLTVKIRIQDSNDDVILAQKIAAAGADALIVHGRRWVDDYDVAVNLQQIARIKQAVNIPVIANGDIDSIASLQRAVEVSACDAFMIARAGSGQPWLYQELLEQRSIHISGVERADLFLTHLRDLAALEDEFKAILQSKSLVRYYFGKNLNATWLQEFYQLGSLLEIEAFIGSLG